MKKLFILILLSIAGLIVWKVFPVFFSAQRGEKTAYQEDHRYENAKARMDQVVFALEDYYIDHQRYPEALKALAKPGASYAGFVPDDPYSPARNEPFAYRTNGEKWVLLSRGPDGDFDFNLEAFFASEAGRYQYVEEYFEPPNPGARYLYDPDSGPAGGGDIIRAGPQLTL